MSISRIIHFLPRRLMWSSMLLALLSLTFLLPSAVASASAHSTTAAHHSSSLVGTWTVQFAVGNPPVHVQEVLTFSSDYTLTSPPGTINGLTIGAASGRWSQVNNQIFFVAVFTEFSDPQQTQLIDTTVAQQSGTISGNTFTSSGMGTAYDLSGNVISNLSQPAQASGTRN